MKTRLLIGILLIGYTVGCGIAPRTIAVSEPSPVKKEATDDTPVSTSTPPLRKVSPAPVKANETFGRTEISKNLEIAYNDWKGIPYLLGGTGYEGVDCSSFMQIVFEDHFGVMLPRTTKQQIKEGKKVKRSSIREGDLIFFKTSKTEMHVGVAKDSKQFIHASTSRGVMISSLDDNYWNQRYLETRRVL